MKDELYEYCFRVKRTIKEILSEFHHVVIPLDYIFDVFPPLRPRQFSIASSVKVRGCEGITISTYKHGIRNTRVRYICVSP